jgi:predicted branched-subunit amino acid permease
MSANMEEKTNLNPFPENLPNANLILVLGILSIAFCWWHFISVVGIALGLITLILSKKEMALYKGSPGRFTVISFNNIKAGRICAIIGLVISLLVFIFVILIFLGILATLPFWGMVG